MTILIYTLCCLFAMGCSVYFFVIFLKGVINELRHDPKPHFSDICIDLIPCLGSLGAFVLATVVLIQTI